MATSSRLFSAKCMHQICVMPWRIKCFLYVMHTLWDYACHMHRNVSDPLPVHYCATPLEFGIMKLAVGKLWTSQNLSQQLKNCITLYAAPDSMCEVRKKIVERLRAGDKHWDVVQHFCVAQLGVKNKVFGTVEKVRLLLCLGPIFFLQCHTLFWLTFN